MRQESNNYPELFTHLPIFYSNKNNNNNNKIKSVLTYVV